MRTRSGQSYEPLSCYKCKKYYAYTKFNNLCSKCCLEKYPNKVNITRKNHLSISKEEENKLIENNTIPESNPLYKYLIKNLNKYGKKKDIMKHVAEMLYMICYTLQKSLSAKQAALIYNLTKKEKKDKNEYKIQHLLCGFIYDRWNIDSKKNGSIGYCYYNISKPRKNTSYINNSVAMIPVFYPRIMIDTSLINKRHRYEFWRNNIPEQCKHQNL